jgi:preprotein translocase subunit Sec63
MLLSEEKLSYIMNHVLCFLSTYPEAHKYFVEYISKAYQALTDPVSRENYEKYGHPDGRQVIA